MDLLTLASKAGISRSYLSMIEKGARVPRPEVLEALAAGLGVSALDLSNDQAVVEHRLWQNLVAETRQERLSPESFAWKLRSLRTSRSLSVRELCDLPLSKSVDLQAWVVRELEYGSREPRPSDLEQLAVVFGSSDADEFLRYLDQAASAGSEDDDLASKRRAVRKLRYDRDSSTWPEVVLRATSKGFTDDQWVVDSSTIPNAEQFVLNGGQLLVDRSIRINEGDLVAVLNGYAVVGLGRMNAGTVNDQNGLPLKGSFWRVVSILYP